MGVTMTNNNSLIKNSLTNKKIAIIATDGFEQSELIQPQESLIALGAHIDVISIDGNESIRGWDENKWGYHVNVDKQIGDISLSEYDAIIFPGGQINPDILRTNKQVVSLIQKATTQNNIKVIAAICHGPWLLVEADILKNKKITSFHSISTDIKNAGAHWEDKNVVVDGKLITSRNPDDIPAFVDAIAFQLTH
jgi:protease I